MVITKDTITPINLVPSDIEGKLLMLGNLLRDLRATGDYGGVTTGSTPFTNDINIVSITHRALAKINKPLTVIELDMGGYLVSKQLDGTTVARAFTESLNESEREFFQYQLLKEEYINGGEKYGLHAGGVYKA